MGSLIVLFRAGLSDLTCFCFTVAVFPSREFSDSWSTEIRNRALSGFLKVGVRKPYFNTPLNWIFKKIEDFNVRKVCSLIFMHFIHINLLIRQILGKEKRERLTYILQEGDEEPGCPPALSITIINTKVNSHISEICHANSNRFILQICKFLYLSLVYICLFYYL